MTTGRFQGSRIGCLLSGSWPWEIAVRKQKLGLDICISSRKGLKKTPAYKHYKIDSQSSFILWRKIIFRYPDNTMSILPGVWTWKTEALLSWIEGVVKRDIDYRLAIHKTTLKKADSVISRFLEQDRYLRQSEIERFSNNLDSFLGIKNQNIKDILKNPYARKTTLGKSTQRIISRVQNVSDPNSELIRSTNHRFVESELLKYKEFFNNVEKLPLTDEQRRSAIILEDRNLLIAAAGSGKSSTLVGKVGYAIRKGYVKPSEILALAFNSDAALELSERMEKRVSPYINGQQVKANTFHALGYSIVQKIAREAGRRVRVANEKEEKPRLSAVFQELQGSESFLNDWVLFAALCKEPIPSDDAFESSEDYDQYIEKQRQAKKNGQPANFTALTGDLVKSAEELAIANWLYIRGVPFVYEKPFSPLPEGWSKYQPDFYFPEIDVWYEHFALNASGQAPPWFGDYARQAQKKREWLTEQVFDRWFETRSAEYRDGSLFERLEEHLVSHGQNFHVRTSDHILSRIRELRQFDEFDLIIDIIHLVKGGMLDRSEFEQCMAVVGDRFRANQFTKVFWPLLEAYNERLVAEGAVDFDDMISQATHALETGEFKIPYKFILVDEFQDLSPGRARFIKSMLAQHSDSVLFGVGDDWQAINGFAGSDLALFMDFESEFGVTEITRLTRTFRCAQGISDVGAIFVQENKKGQIEKEVISELDRTVDGVIDLRGIQQNLVIGSIEQELESISGRVVAERRALQPDDDPVENVTVYLLSRYGESKSNTLKDNNDWLVAIKQRYQNTVDIEFMTMHSSKGLEADYVFLLDFRQAYGLTFPSTMRSDPLKEALLTNRDSFPHAEERRLFYVAITRAKKQAFVYFDYRNPSVFALELMQRKYRGRVTYNGEELPDRCNKCRRGFMVERSGPYGPLLGCTQYRDRGCDNRRSVKES